MTRLICYYLAAVAVLVSPWTCAVALAQAERAPTVLAIHGRSATFPATPVVNAAILDALRANPAVAVDYFTEYLESERLPQQAAPALRDHIRKKYQGRRVDVVIAINDAALRFTLEHRAELFPGAAIVYSGIAFPEGIDRNVGGGLTGIRRGVAAYRATLELALNLHPLADRVFVVAGARDDQTSDSVRAELRDFETRVALNYIRAPNVSRLLEAIRTVPPRSVILYIRHQDNESGPMMYSNEVAHLIAEAAAVPVYGTNDDYITSGIVGGVSRRTSETAARVGEMARRILEGVRAKDIAIEDARLVPIFDWRQVMRWRIDPSRLPADAEIRFRTPTVWESYRGYIQTAAAVIIAQLLLIVALLAQRAQRRRAEEALRKSEGTLRRSYERTRLLAGRLINAQEAARAEIARDLHDDLCQELVGVAMAVSFLQRSPGNLQDGQTQHALSTLHRHTLGMVDCVRNLSHELHPATLRLVGLAAALGGHCVEVEKRHDVHVSFSVEGELDNIDGDTALCLFRIAQEALRNGMLHGGARRLAVSLAKGGDWVNLTVSDDGRGFDVEAVRRADPGLGLVNMEERARVLGGEVEILSRPQYGTIIRARIPLTETEPAVHTDVRVRVPELGPQVLSKSTDEA
jgi:signal transduction histidine kinase